MVRLPRNDVEQAGRLRRSTRRSPQSRIRAAPRWRRAMRDADGFVDGGIAAINPWMD